MLKIHRNRKGFTLIELLIVIAIIGILAAIALPAYMDYAKKARLTEAFTAMGAVKTGITAYASEATGGPENADFTNIDQIQGNLGVTVATKYIAAMATTGTATTAQITATLTGIDGNVNGKTIILSSGDANLQTWSWNDTGTLYTNTFTRKYMPKN